MKEEIRHGEIYDVFINTTYILLKIALDSVRYLLNLVTSKLVPLTLIKIGWVINLVSPCLHMEVSTHVLRLKVDKLKP